MQVFMFKRSYFYPIISAANGLNKKFHKIFEYLFERKMDYQT